MVIVTLVFSNYSYFIFSVDFVSEICYNKSTEREVNNMRMKQIANNVALQTILYTISGLANIHIYATELGYFKRDIYTGFHKDFSDIYKYENCKVTGISASENTINISIEE